MDRAWNVLSLTFLLCACTLSGPPVQAVNPTLPADGATPRPVTLIPLVTVAPALADTPTPSDTDVPQNSTGVQPDGTGVPLDAPTVQSNVSTHSPTPACTETSGTVVKRRTHLPTLEQTIWFRVYVPPCYDTQTGRAYPVLYLIHGLRMNESAWDDLGADETADRLIASGEIPPLIIVMPRAPEDDRYAEAVVADLVPYIDATYRTLAGRQTRAIGGMSRGGGWAVRIGFQHPGVFGAVGLHSLAIFYADEDRVWRWLNDLTEGRRPRIYMDIGRADSGDESAAWLDQALTQRGIPHEFHLYPGAHDYKYWKEHLAEYLRWYAAGW